MSSIGLFDVFLAIICYLLLRYLRNNKNKALPKNWPLIGMLPDLLLQVHCIHDWCTEVLEQSRCTFLLKGPWFSKMDMLVTAEPANIHYIMSSNFSNFPKGSEFKKMFDILGDGIFNSDLELWQEQRKVAHLLVNHPRFNRFVVRTSQEKVTKGLIPVLEHVCKQGLVVDLQDLFQRFTFDATSIIVTGFDPGCLSVDFPEVAFSKALDDAEEAIFYRHVLPESVWMLQKWLDIGQEKKLGKAWETFDQITARIISTKKQELSKTGMNNLPEEDGQEGIDLLTCYLNTDEEPKSSSSDDKSLRDTIVNFMIAGRDTTSSALSWFFWLLSKNPHVESRIREELKAISSEETENLWPFEMDKLKNMVYLHGALCETLRLYPPVPFQRKTPVRPDTLPSGHHVDPNLRILFSMYAMGRMTSIWGEDCLEFKPERWISERGGIKHEPSYKFVAFNAGPRTCLGKEVAFTQMKAVAAAIIHHFRVQVVDGQTVEPNTSIILHMKHGIKVRLSKLGTQSVEES